MRYQDPPLADRLAAEYVLGTLKGRARRRFESLLAAHPALRGYVREWELKLNRLAEQAPSREPPPAVWKSLRQRLFTDRDRPRWFERLALWRGLAAGSGLLAGVLAAILFLTPPQEAGGQMIVISDMQSRQPMWVASASADKGRLHFTSLKAMEMPPNIRCLLWLKPEGSQQVYPLGLLPDKADRAMLEVPEDKRPLLPGQLLVTLEPIPDLRAPLPTAPSTPPRYEGTWMPMPTET